MPSVTLTPLFSYSFNRANVNPLTAPWSIDSASDTGLQIISDLCRSASLGSNGIQVYGNSLPNDCYASATIGSALATYIGIGIRQTDGGYHTSQDWPGYLLLVLGTSWLLVQGNYGGTIASGSGLTVNSGDVFSVAAIANTVYAFQNSSQLCAVTNTAFASGGSILELAEAGSGGSGGISNWVVGSAVDPVTDSYDPTIPFLGSISEAADNSKGTQYIGHVKVLASAPAGLPNPYLGHSFKVSSPVAGRGDPLLGQVVIVAGPPAGVPDPYLGQIDEQ
jgi:hypothetical protein